MVESGFPLSRGIAEPLEAVSAPPLSVGGVLGKVVNLTLRSLVGVAAAVLPVLDYISRSLSQALGNVLDGSVDLGKYGGFLVTLLVLPLAVYVLRSGSTTPSWTSPSESAQYVPPKTQETLSAANIFDHSARLINSHSLHAQSGIESDIAESVSNTRDKLSTMNCPLAAHDNPTRPTTDKVINAPKEKLLERQPEYNRAKWNALEDRIRTLECKVEQAIELGKPIIKTGLDDTSDWSKTSDTRPDFALHPAGARVIPFLTSATYTMPRSIFGKALGFVTGVGYRYPTCLPPIAALLPQNHAGHCWPLQGSTGQLGVKLARRAYISDITIDHVPKELGFDPRSTPRQMEVWGLVEGDDNLAKVNWWLADRQRQTSDMPKSGLPRVLGDEERVRMRLRGKLKYIRIAEFMYDAHSKKSVQTFPVDLDVKALRVDIGVVVLVVRSNWGMPEFTCLHRFRVHGEIFGEITSW